MNRAGPEPIHRPWCPPLSAALSAALKAAVLAVLALLAVAGLGGCNSLFYQPNRVRYTLPQQFGLRFEDVYFRSTDGTRLTGWFLPAEGTARATIVYFHGNGANITNHLPVVRWLPAAHYAVFIFDYRGYGVSEGVPTREGVVQDGVAAIRYVRGRADVDPQRIVIFGQSLGGAVAISALAAAGTGGVRALVLEGAFGSYREVARTFMNEHWFTWPFQYPLAWLAISDDLRPYDDLPALAGVPLLSIHSTGDHTVPIENGRRLFDAFPGPDKTFWQVEGLRHIATFMADNSPWRRRLLDYLAKRLEPARAPAAAPAPPPRAVVTSPAARVSIVYPKKHVIMNHWAY